MYIYDTDNDFFLFHTANMYICNIYANTQGIMGKNNGLYVL